MHVGGEVVVVVAEDPAIQVDGQHVQRLDDEEGRDGAADHAPPEGVEVRLAPAGGVEDRHERRDRHEEEAHREAVARVVVQVARHDDVVVVRPFVVLEGRLGVGHDVARAVELLEVHQLLVQVVQRLAALRGRERARRLLRQGRGGAAVRLRRGVEIVGAGLDHLELHLDVVLLDRAEVVVVEALLEDDLVIVDGHGGVDAVERGVEVRAADGAAHGDGP
mmetsp:Transcript_47545/g.146707  ORF Transcript_47545/g.146707 Transcript_47545/m.146707 type:complete len:220 (+) Transcript_47545:170-829(+)